MVTKDMLALWQSKGRLFDAFGVLHTKLIIADDTGCGEGATVSRCGQQGVHNPAKMATYFVRFPITL